MARVPFLLLSVIIPYSAYIRTRMIFLRGAGKVKNSPCTQFGHRGYVWFWIDVYDMGWISSSMLSQNWISDWYTISKSGLFVISLNLPYACSALSLLFFSAEKSPNVLSFRQFMSFCLLYPTYWFTTYISSISFVLRNTRGVDMAVILSASIFSMDAPLNVIPCTLYNEVSGVFPTSMSLFS